MITMQASIDSDIFDAIDSMKQFSMGLPMSVLFPNAAQAVKAGAYAIAEQWKSYAGGESLPSGDKIKNPSGGYAKGIAVKQNGMWDYTIYNHSDIAQWLEDGTKAVDFKQTHPYGNKGRVAKKKIPKKEGGGYRYVPYLIIPIRWGTPENGARIGIKNIIPEQIYNKLRVEIKSGTFKKTIVLAGNKYTSNFWGDMQKRSSYSWGSRLQGDAFKGIENSETTGTPYISGLVAMEKGRGSGYMTFRVISADSPQNSWIKPATKGMQIAKQTADFMTGKVDKMVNEAFNVDLKNAFGETSE
jgi:hypothetical protein